MQTGYIKARVYTSGAEIPIENASFTVYKSGDSKNIIAFAKTDSSGNTPYISVDAPDESLSQSEGNINPFTTVDVRIDHVEYKTVNITGVQIFANQVSIQETAMIPVDRNIPNDSRSENFSISKQNL